MAARIVIAFLGILLVVLQGRLWVSDDGFREVARLRSTIDAQGRENERLERRNDRLEAEVRALKEGGVAVEERARADLGLIDRAETFYLFGTRPAPADVPPYPLPAGPDVAPGEEEPRQLRAGEDPPRPRG